MTKRLDLPSGHLLETTYLESEYLVRYVCVCGVLGRARRNYNTEDIESKAIRNHRTHAFNAARRASVGAEG